MLIQRIHHVAYRCKDAKETVDWYVRHLGMNFVLAIAEDRVPSTKAPDPYMHVFLDAGAGNILAFFEIPNSPPMGRDPNTPDWVQHIAYKVDSVETLEKTDAIRRPQRFAQLLEVCIADYHGRAGERGEYAAPALWQAALAAVMAVDAGAVAAACSDPAGIPARVREARVRSVRALLGGPKDDAQ